MLEIKFTKGALGDWSALDSTTRTKLKKKLRSLTEMDAPRTRLMGFGGLLFKVKITKPQFRLIYRIDPNRDQLIVIAVGPRDVVYTQLKKSR